MKLVTYDPETGKITSATTGDYDKSIQNRNFIEVEDDVNLEGKKVDTDTLELTDE